MKHKQISFLSFFFLMFSLVSCGCDHKLKKVVLKEPTCLENGIGILRCTVCGETSEESIIPALGHNYVNQEVKATCDEPGYLLQFCTRCGEENKTVNAEALGHNYLDTVHEPDCINEGYVHHECTICGDAFDDSKKLALGHDYVDTIHDSDCINAGYVRHECKRCGYSFDDSEQAALGHDFEITHQDLTCTQDQCTKKVCKRCNYTVVEDVIKATGHEFEGEEVEPTCTEDGYRDVKCAKCGLVEKWEKPALGHSLVKYEEIPATCETDGHSAYEKCQRLGCDYETPHQTYKALGHDYVINEKKPTCTEDGYVKKTCKNCNKTTIETVDKLGHDFEEKMTKAPSCTEDGEREKFCKNCKLVIKEKINKLGHDYEKHSGKEASCTEDGWQDYEVCKRCGDSNLQKKTIKALGHDFEEFHVDATTYVKAYTLKRCKRKNCNYEERNYDTNSSYVTQNSVKPNELYSAGNWNKKYIKSFENDDSKYFLIDLGKIERFALIQFFEFTQKDASIKYEANNVTGIDDIKSSLSLLSNYTNSFKEKIIQKIKAELDGVQVDELNASIDKYDDNRFNDLLGKFNVNPKIDYCNIKTEINEKKNNDFNAKQYFDDVNKKNYVEGVKYAYLATAPVETFLGVKFDVVTKKLNFKNFANVGEVSVDMFASDVDMSISEDKEYDFLISHSGDFNQKFIDFSNADAYETNHPKVQRYNAWKPMHIIAHGDGYFDFEMSDFDSLYSRGYDRFEINTVLRYHTTVWSNAALHAQLTIVTGNAEGKEEENHAAFTGTNNKYTTENSDIVLSYSNETSMLKGKLGLGVHCWNENFGTGDYYLDKIEMTVTFYNSRARY